MADLETPADGAPSLDPDEVSDRSFPTAFRGFDPVQVRAFLGTVADELRRLHALEAELRAAAAAGTAEPEPAADVAEDQAPSADAALAEAKAEADRLVRVARERVATWGSAATAEATRVLDEARAEAARLRATATDDLKGRIEDAEASAVRKIAEAEREAAAIRVKAREEADATIEAARERGREMVAEAQAARERMLADLAKRKRSAQAQLEALRAGRDRLLDTLKVARRSIDEMTGRFETGDGLGPGGPSAGPPPSSGVPSGPVTTTPGLASTEARPRPAVGRSVVIGSRIGGVDDAPPADLGLVARITEPSSGEVDVADAARPASFPARSRGVVIGEGPPSSGRPAIAAPQASTPEPETPAGAPTTGPPVEERQPEPPPQPERRSSALRILRRNRGGHGAPSVPPLIGRESSVEGVRILGREPEPRQEPERAPEPPPSLPSDEPPEVEPEVDLDALLADRPLPEELPAPALEPEPDELRADEGAAGRAGGEGDEAPSVAAADDRAPATSTTAPATAEPVDHDEDPGPPTEPLSRDEIRPRIEDLFARIRADREAATASARRVLADADADPGADRDADADVDGAEHEPAPVVAGAPSVEHTTDADENLLQARDAVTEPLAGQLTKRLKRVLQDEQNASLDRLRTTRGTDGVDQLLSRPDDQRTPYRVVATAFLEQAARGGAASSEFGAVAVAVAVDDLAAQLADDLAGAMRARLDTVLGAAASDGLDLSGIGERVSSVYREWKVQKIERLALHYLVAAHERGNFLARPEGTPLRWIVDDEGPCPDCEDNALAGPTARGERFPTGQLHPPAHVGCRCLLAPAPH
jgi:DivIVA domain-containing protein